LVNKIFGIIPENFESTALEVFRFQYEQNPFYAEYAKAIGKTPECVHSVTEIPFLPIRFFKSTSIKTTAFEPQAIFESSGTTGSVNSRHYVKDLKIYEESFTKTFHKFYGSIKDWCILGLLPSYLERDNSSLVYMVKQLIEVSGKSDSGFYLNDFEKLSNVLKRQEQVGQKTLLIGVTFALLDFAEQFAQPLKHTIIIETGGMKGRREEMIREEVHAELKKAFGLSKIHSEYGMTELLSQAYSVGDGIFQSPEWMRILIRDEEDPFQIKNAGSGVVNVIDLANIYSCSFIATDDAGRLYEDGSFEILGRIDGSDIRGCSLMVV